ncbi:cell wall protein [Actinomyces sp.]
MIRTRNAVLATAAIAALITGGTALAGPRDAHAQDQAFSISQNVTTDAVTVCNTNPVIATYHGTVNLTIPVVTLLANFQDEMQAAAAAGQSPHAAGAQNPDITFTVSVPQGTQVGPGTVTNSSSLISNWWLSPNSEKTEMKVNLHLTQTDWQGLYTTYTSEKSNPLGHTITIKIPYAVGANNAADAARIAQEQVTSTATVKFYTGGDTPNKVFTSAVVSNPIASMPTDCFSNAPQRTTRWVDAETGTDLKAPQTGPNFFQAAGIPDYEFVSSELSTDRMTGYYKYKKVFGDLPVNGDDSTVDTDFKISADDAAPAQKETIQAENKQSLLTIENVIHLNNLQGGRIATLLQKYEESPAAFDEMVLKNARLGFTTQITLPEQLKFADPSAISISGIPEGFTTKTVAIDGQTARVTVDVNDPESITTIEALKDAMSKLQGEAVITIKKIAFADSARPDTDYTIEHQTQGLVSVDIAKQLGVIVRPGTPSPACPPTMGDYDQLKPAEPLPVQGTVFDPPAPACPPTTAYSAAWTFPMTGPSAGWAEAPLMEHSLNYTSSESYPFVTRLTFKADPQPTPPAPTPTPSTPTFGPQLAKTGAAGMLFLVGAAAAGATGMMLRRRSRA